ncbi:hypothetical protein HDU82_007148 [Entophlyctis luteolus]|nr:hypothetical protein HDU82_007148 [Entophlyctis luteolus]
MAPATWTGAGTGGVAGPVENTASGTQLSVAVEWVRNSAIEFTLTVTAAGTTPTNPTPRDHSFSSAAGGGGTDVSPTDVVAQVTRTLFESESLYALVIAKHPLRCFALHAPPSSSSRMTVRTLTVFLQAVVDDPILMADKVHVRPFFFSPFKFIPEAYTPPASMISRRSAPNAFPSLFSKPPDDVDVYFTQVKAHVSALHTALKTVVREVDGLLTMQTEYVRVLSEIQMKISEVSLHEERDALATYAFLVPTRIERKKKHPPYSPNRNYRKLVKAMNAIELHVGHQSTYQTSSLRPMLHVLRRSVESMLAALEARLVALDDYEDACKNVVRKRQIIERMTHSTSQSRAETAVYDLRTAVEAEKNAKEAFVGASTLINDAYVPVRNFQAQQLQEALNGYAESQLLINRNLLDAMTLWCL